MNLPNRVTLELSNRCNRRCDKCPRLKTDYPLGDMTLDLLETILGQLPPNTTIVPFFRGESLIHPRFYRIMQLFRRFENVQIATNGDLLNLDNQNAILNSCTFISYSLHKFERPKEVMGVINFLERARNRGTITQASILDNLISGDKKLFVEKWLNYVDRFRIYIEHSKDGFGDVEETYKVIKPGKPCKKPFEDMVVYWDGKVALCNHDWDNQKPLGDLNIQTVEDVWGGERYQEIRKLHKEGLLKQVETCKDCDYWMTDYLPDKMFGELYVGTM